jgi:hypothetical protein
VPFVDLFRTQSSNILNDRLWFLVHSFWESVSLHSLNVTSTSSWSLKFWSMQIRFAVLPVWLGFFYMLSEYLRPIVWIQTQQLLFCIRPGLCCPDFTTIKEIWESWRIINSHPWIFRSLTNIGHSLSSPNIIYLVQSTLLNAESLNIFTFQTLFRFT